MDASTRQPVHVVYGGAHLFRSNVCRKVGDLALRALDEHAPDPETLADAMGISSRIAGAVFERVQNKLRAEPVEDYRIDFEDGYGYRPDHEEDQAARCAAREMRKGIDEGSLPPFFGIRVKPFHQELKARSLRTLELFLTSLGSAPDHFTVTLAKITRAEEVAALAEQLERFGVKRMELMIETPQALFALPQLAGAARGLCTGAHFGAYDYTASLGIAASHQDLLHPACDFARFTIQARLAGTGIAISDGANNLIPAGDRAAVHRAWRAHYQRVRRALEHGFYQGWDVHPAQLPARFAAVYSFFLEGREEAAARLKNFLARAAQATLSGGIFDDAATGQGLLNYFIRALNCGAISATEAESLTGLSVEELRSASFTRILNGRSARVS